MTRQYAIEEWCEIIRIVFQTEHNLQDELQAILIQRADLGTAKTADEYVRRIAEEIVKKYKYLGD